MDRLDECTQTQITINPIQPYLYPRYAYFDPPYASPMQTTPRNVVHQHPMIIPSYHPVSMIPLRRQMPIYTSPTIVKKPAYINFTYRSPIHTNNFEQQTFTKSQQKQKIQQSREQQGQINNVDQLKTQQKSLDKQQQLNQQKIQFILRQSCENSEKNKDFGNQNEKLYNSNNIFQQSKKEEQINDIKEMQLQIMKQNNNEQQPINSDIVLSSIHKVSSHYLGMDETPFQKEQKQQQDIVEDDKAKSSPKSSKKQIQENFTQSQKQQSDHIIEKDKKKSSSVFESVQLSNSEQAHSQKTIIQHSSVNQESNSFNISKSNSLAIQEPLINRNELLYRSSDGRQSQIYDSQILSHQKNSNTNQFSPSQSLHKSDGAFKQRNWKRSSGFSKKDERPLALIAPITQHSQREEEHSPRYYTKKEEESFSVQNKQQNSFSNISSSNHSKTASNKNVEISEPKYADNLSKSQYRLSQQQRIIQKNQGNKNNQQKIETIHHKFDLSSQKIKVKKNKLEGLSWVSNKR